MADVAWEKSPPAIYSVVTGFFPETSPKETWATNPRPLLVCGVAQDPTSGTFFCRVAYGTTQNLNKAHDDDIVIGNISMLNDLGLKKPTRFVTFSGRYMAILPWTEEFFRPWTGYKSPVLSVLSQDVQRFAGHILSSLDDLPKS